MPNPFTYGTVVTGDDFIDREHELRELTAKLKETEMKPGRCIHPDLDQEVKLPVLPHGASWRRRVNRESQGLWHHLLF